MSRPGGPASRAGYVGRCVYLVMCLLIGDVVGQYHALWPICRQRGLCGSRAMFDESIARFDIAYASVGLLVGVASIAVVGWVRRGVR